VRAADTSNASFTVEVLSRAGIPGFLPDKSASTPEHIHTQQQQEEVVVVQGRLGYLRGGKSTEGELGPGEKLVIPAGQCMCVVARWGWVCGAGVRVWDRAGWCVQGLRDVGLSVAAHSTTMLFYPAPCALRSGDT